MSRFSITINLGLSIILKDKLNNIIIDMDLNLKLIDYHIEVKDIFVFEIIHKKQEYKL